MSKEPDQSSVESGNRLMHGILLTLAAFVVAMVGVAVLVFTGSLWLAVPLWLVALWLLLKGRPALMDEFQQLDQQTPYPDNVARAGEQREACPCCNCPTFPPGAEHNGDACLMCDWSTDCPLPMDVARRNFKNHLTVYAGRERPQWRLEMTPDEVEVKEELLETYAKLVSGTSTHRVASWYEASLLESRLKGIQMREVDRGLP